MSKKIKAITLLGGAAVGAALLVAAPTASADPSSSTSCQGGSQACNSWGQSVSTTNENTRINGPGTLGAYATAPNRGGYVSGSASNPSSNPYDPNPPQNGYGGIVHDLAHPGNSSPQGSPGNPGGVGSTK
jgi:hypothetical protein